MCTVTFVPQADNTYILTSNRDERPMRSATTMTNVEKWGKQLLFPRDPKANGTWIAASNTKQLVCVLNGAFIKHQHRPPYRMSRGIMALEFFSYENAEAFAHQFDFIGIEPFTMVIFDDKKLYELRWDEKKVHFKKLNINNNHIWSSSPLYPPEWQEKRIQWFDTWQKKYKQFDRAAILDFHKNAGKENSEFGVVMNRFNIVRTVSITSVLLGIHSIDMQHENLIESNLSRSLLQLAL